MSFGVVHPFFGTLSIEQTSLLLTSMTVGASEPSAVFATLPQNVRAALEDRAEALRGVAAEQRIAWMVRELKALLLQNGHRGLERVDPTWLVYKLRGERPRVVGILLLTLPPALVRAVLRRLPESVHQALPAKQQLQRVDPVLRDNIRIIFENRFYPMPAPLSSKASVGLEALIHLERTELHILIRALGLIELGQAFASVGRIALVELCRRLSDAHAQELISAVRTASDSGDIPDPRNAQRFLSRVVVNFSKVEEFFQKAGLWRLAKAYHNIAPASQNALAQRLPKAAGQLFLNYLGRTEEVTESSPEKLQALQDSILVQLVLASHKSEISERWKAMDITWHNQQTAQAALMQGLHQMNHPNSTQTESKASDSSSH